MYFIGIFLPLTAGVVIAAFIPLPIFLVGSYIYMIVYYFVKVRYTEYFQDTKKEDWAITDSKKVKNRA